MVVSTYFELFILAMIVLNTIFMMFKSPYMDSKTSYIIEVIQVIFTVIFIIETSLKLYAFEMRYFRDTWNLIDFTIMVVSLFNVKSFRALRTFRIVRLLKFFREMK